MRKKHSHGRSVSKPEEQGFDFLFRKCPLPILVYDLETLAFLEVNDAAETVYGYTRAEFQRMTLKDIRPLEEPPCLPLPQSAEWRYHTRDGRISDVAVICHTLEWNERQAALVLCRDITETKRVEQELRESEERLRSIFRAAPIGIGIVADRIILDVNTYICEITGYSREDLVGFNARLLYPTQQDFDYVGREIYRQMAKQGIGTVETRMMKKDGTIVDVLLSSTPIDSSDLSRGFMFTALDITDFKLNRTELDRARQDWEQIFQAIGHPTFILDKDYAIIAANRAAANAAGRSREEMAGSKCYTVLHGTDSPPENCPMARLLASGHQGIGDMEIEALGGVFLVSCTPVFDDAGRLEKAIHIATDITERKRAEEALRESEARYQDLYENAPDMYISVDPATNRIIQCNQTMAGATGYTKEEILGRSAVEIYHPDCMEEAKKAFQLFMSTGRVRNAELQLRRKDGSKADVSLNASAVRDADGEIIQRRSMFRDITERKQAEAERVKLEAQLRQAQKMEAVGRLAGGVAHDFNNMLSVITGYASMALDRLSPADPLHSDLNEILQAARRSADLTRQLLAFARKQIIAPRVLDLNALIAESKKMLGRLIGEDIELTFFPGTDLYTVNIDPSQVEQILANMAVNSRDAIAGAGNMIVETSNVVLDQAYCDAHPGCTPGEYVLLAWSDNGSGMNKQTLEQVFEPFFTTKGKGIGTGLGLATIYGIVKQNQGFINVYSEPGQGTTVKIYLPRFEGKAQRVAETEEQGPLEGTETILLVEDEEQMLRLCRTALQRLGYTVIAAHTPGEAILLCEKHDGDIPLLITDVIMPAMNGKELKERVETLRPGIKVIYTSGYTANVITRRGVLSEGARFIQKPFPPNDLARKVRNALDQ